MRPMWPDCPSRPLPFWLKCAKQIPMGTCMSDAYRMRLALSPGEGPSKWDCKSHLALACRMHLVCTLLPAFARAQVVRHGLGLYVGVGSPALVSYLRLLPHICVSWFRGALRASPKTELHQFRNQTNHSDTTFHNLRPRPPTPPPRRVLTMPRKYKPVQCSTRGVRKCAKMLSNQIIIIYWSLKAYYTLSIQVC
jgi:hypothetical protein